MRHAKREGGGRNSLVFPLRDMLRLLPSFAIYCICYIAPYCWSFLSSFGDNSRLSGFVGLENYGVLFRDGYYLLSLQNTLLFLFASITITLTIAVILAHLMYSFHVFRPVIVVLLIPFFLPAPSITVIWRVMMGNVSGIAEFLDLKDADWKFISLLFLFVWKNVGASVALLLSGLCAVDPDIFSAGHLDGASRRVQLYRIEIPLLKHVIMFVLLYLFMNGVRIYRECYLLYGGYPPASVYFVPHYINNYFARLDYSLLCCAATVFSHLILAVFCGIWILLRKEEDEL